MSPAVVSNSYITYMRAGKFPVECTAASTNTEASVPLSLDLKLKISLSFFLEFELQSRLASARPARRSAIRTMMTSMMMIIVPLAVIPLRSRIDNSLLLRGCENYRVSFDDSWGWWGWLACKNKSVLLINMFVSSFWKTNFSAICVSNPFHLLFPFKFSFSFSIRVKRFVVVIMIVIKRTSGGSTTRRHIFSNVSISWDSLFSVAIGHRGSSGSNYIVLASIPAHPILEKWIVHPR